MNRQAAAVTIGLLVAAIAAPSASATLRMDEAKPRHRNWARQAQRNVPLPNAHIFIASGDWDAQYDPDEQVIWLPKPARSSWSYGDEHILFLHELGHVVDFTHFTRADRNEWRTLIGTACAWRSPHCLIAQQERTEAGVVYMPKSVRLAPSETWAEAYAACALGMSREEVEDSRVVSYHWRPSIAKQQLCAAVKWLAS